MCLHQEFLLFLIAVSYISHNVSMPICHSNMSFLKLALENLRVAENQSVHDLFEDVPKAYSNGTLEPLDGITFPVGNTTDPKFQKSLCTINNYLKHDLPLLIGTVLSNSSMILYNTKAFLLNFQELAELLGNKLADLQQCPTNVTKMKDYAKKNFVLRIFYFSRKWTETFLQHYNHTSHC